jgi:hypothetical protein
MSIMVLSRGGHDEGGKTDSSSWVHTQDAAADTPSAVCVSY